jgi:hypothetical protein
MNLTNICAHQKFRVEVDGGWCYEVATSSAVDAALVVAQLVHGEWARVESWPITFRVIDSEGKKIWVQVECDMEPSFRVVHVMYPQGGD